jgi:hypothetical protein
VRLGRLSELPPGFEGRSTFESGANRDSNARRNRGPATATARQWNDAHLADGVRRPSGAALGCGPRAAHNRLPEPRMSRLTLQWFNLDQQEGQDLCLKIPICDVYAPIIDRAFPAMRHIGWRSGTQGTCFTYIKRITSVDLDSLKDFLQLLHEIQCLTLTERLAPHFQSDLDEAYALDFNFQTDVLPRAYTEVGSLEHIAKEQQNDAAVAQLITRLAEVIRRHPTLPALKSSRQCHRAPQRPFISLLK